MKNGFIKKQKSNIIWMVLCVLSVALFLWLFLNYNNKNTDYLQLTKEQMYAITNGLNIPGVDKPLGEVPAFERFNVMVHGSGSMPHFKYIPVPNGPPVYSYIPMGVPTSPLDYVAGMAGWDQGAFITSLVKALGKQQEEKYVLTKALFLTATVVPIMLFTYVFNFIIINIASGGITQTIFGGAEFDVTKLPFAFWAMCISVPLVLIVILLFQTIGMVNLDDKKPMGVKLKELAIGSFKTLIYIFMIPVGFFVLGTGVDITLFYISKFVGAKDGSQRFIFTDNIYTIIFFGEKPGESADFFKRYIYLDALLSAVLVSGGIGGGVGKIFGLENVIKATNFSGYLGIVIGALLLVFLTTLFISIIEKMFWTFINFVIMIFYVCASTFDGGVKMKQAREKVIARALSITIISLGISLSSNAINGLKGFVTHFPSVSAYGLYPFIVAVVYSLIIMSVLIGIKKISAEIESQVGETSNYSMIEQSVKSDAQTGSSFLRKGRSPSIKGAASGGVGAVGGLTSNVIGQG